MRTSRTAAEPGLAEGEPIERYWTLFEDPLLTQLVEDADRSQQGSAGGDGEPAGGASRAAPGGFRSVSDSQLRPAATQESRFGARAIPGVHDQQEREFDTAQAGFDGLWELDLFGRVRRNVEAARADVGASEATLRDARVSVIAEVARDYFILRGLQDQLALTRRNADNQLSTLKLTRTRAGGGPGQSSSTPRAPRRSGRPRSPPFRPRGVDRHDHLSAQRAHRPHSRRHSRRSSSPAAPMPALPAFNAMGTPERLLRRRPDIRVAERRLAGATARVGVAMGDLFPKVTLTGEVGYWAPTFGEFGQSQARFFSVGPSISWAAFDMGRVLARIGEPRAQTDAALAQYQSAVLNALEDTEGAMITYGRSQIPTRSAEAGGRRERQGRGPRAQALRGRLDRFPRGARRRAHRAERGAVLSQSRTDAATSLIAVYKALGAGWAIPEGSAPVQASR